jgi:hypothetical protein
MRKTRLDRKKDKLKSSKKQELSRDMRWNFWVSLSRICHLAQSWPMLLFSLLWWLEPSTTDWPIWTRRSKLKVTSVDHPRRTRNNQKLKVKVLDFFIHIDVNSIKNICILWGQLYFVWNSFVPVVIKYSLGLSIKWEQVNAKQYLVYHM